MQIFIMTLLICSATVSALALFYIVITPILAKRYSVKGRYYAWLVIVIGLIIPFRPHFNNAIVKGQAMPIPENAALPHTLPSISWWQVAAVVWLAGMIAFLAYHAIKHYRFMKMVKRWNEAVNDESVLTVFQNLKSEMGINRRIDLSLCSCIGGPMLVGLTKPKILLPQLNFAEDELRFILKHELVHFKRNDLCYKCLVLIATAMHWFNPIIYFMAKEIGVVCELSCDADVVQSTGTDTRQHYSETIIGVVKYQSKLKTALSTHFHGGKKGMKNRISSIMDTTKKKAGTAILYIALILTIGTGATVCYIIGLSI